MPEEKKNVHFSNGYKIFVTRCISENNIWMSYLPMKLGSRIRVATKIVRNGKCWLLTRINKKVGLLLVLLRPSYFCLKSYPVIIENVWDILRLNGKFANSFPLVRFILVEPWNSSMKLKDVQSSKKQPYFHCGNILIKK